MNRDLDLVVVIVAAVGVMDRVNVFSEFTFFFCRMCIFTDVYRKKVFLVRNGLNVFLVVIFTGTTSFFFYEDQYRKTSLSINIYQGWILFGPNGGENEKDSE